jgi:hypothetical protein
VVAGGVGVHRGISRGASRPGNGWSWGREKGAAKAIREAPAPSALRG